MLKRKIMDQLVEWKKEKNKNVLLVTGARQVGKTFIIKEFANQYYDNYIYINFIEKPEYITIFEGNLDATTIQKQISLRIKNAEFIEGKTLIIFDEIQACQNAITALKFLNEDKRFDYIASGSLLGIAYKRVSSFPVGSIKRIELKSLDFEEYLWAIGINEDTILYLKEFFDNKKTIPDGMHKQMMSYFKEYIVVGGMPAVVQDFVNNHNFQRVLEIQRNIIEDYKDDIVKYANAKEKSKIRACFESIPKHLAKDYKKFRYSLVEKGATAEKYAGSLEWLYDAGIINFCYNLSHPELPFAGNAKENVFKVYMRDTGLLIAMLEDGSQLEIIDGNLGIYKGAIYENIIADIFTKLNKKLYYFEYNSTLEIDFFIRYNNLATAVEVKSADNTKSKSLQSVINNYDVKNAIRLSSKNLGSSNNIISLPLYMSIFL